jgi:hypothetical protein
MRVAGQELDQRLTVHMQRFKVNVPNNARLRYMFVHAHGLAI